MLRLPSTTTTADEAMAAATPMELEATLAMLNPSTQEDEVAVASPPEQRKLQPSAGEFSEGRRNLVHRLEQATPRGTHQASAQYKTAAATPEGEDADSRCKRLSTERQRLCRARADVQRSLEQQVEAEQAALAEKAALEAKLEARKAAYFMRRARRDRKAVLWGEMAPSCLAAASEFGFMRGMWDMRDSERGYALVQPLVREEWWWPWDELPRPLKLAAVDLGYDRLAWQTETFEHSGQRFLDWEEVEIDRMVVEEAGSVCSDSELIHGHDEANGIRMSGCMDTMDLLDQPSRRSYCQGAFAAYRPRGGYYAGGVYRWGYISRHRYMPPTDDMYCRPDWSSGLRAL